VASLRAGWGETVDYVENLGVTPSFSRPRVSDDNAFSEALLARRHRVYQRAQARHPARWSRVTRSWTPAGPVRLGSSPNLTPAVQELKPIG